MNESPSRPRVKRTPEQLAAHFQAKANAARARAGQQQRKEDTRRKILAGAGLLGLAEAGDEGAKRALAKIKGGLTRPQDREIFASLDLAGEDGAKAEAKPQLAGGEAILARLMIRGFGPQGGLKAGELHHWEAITKLFQMEAEEREVLFEWWQAQGYPLKAG